MNNELECPSCQHVVEPMPNDTCPICYASFNEEASPPPSLRALPREAPDLANARPVRVVLQWVLGTTALVAGGMEVMEAFDQTYVSFALASLIMCTPAAIWQLLVLRHHGLRVNAVTWIVGVILVWGLLTPASIYLMMPHARSLPAFFTLMFWPAVPAAIMQAQSLGMAKGKRIGWIGTSLVGFAIAGLVVCMLSATTRAGLIGMMVGLGMSSTALLLPGLLKAQATRVADGVPAPR